MPNLDNRISLGNLLTMLTAVVAVAAAWGMAQAQAKGMEARVLAHDAKLTALDTRLRTLETSAARDAARLDAILAVAQETRAEVTELRRIISTRGTPQ